MQPIVTLTVNPSIDIITQIAHVAPNRKLRCEAPQYTPGGGGIHVSRAIKRLGGETLAIYPAGGLNGRLLANLLDHEQIAHHPIIVNEFSRENLIIEEETSNSHYHFIMPGSTLQNSEWQQCLEALAAVDPSPEYIVASGTLAPGVPQDFYARVAKTASDCNARLLLNTTGEAILSVLDHGIFLLKLSMRDLQAITQQEIDDEQGQERALMQFIEKNHTKIAVLSLGKAGALVASHRGTHRLRAPSVPVKSDVGAGDSLLAGIVLKLAQRESLKKALCYGIAAGTATVMVPDSELCRLEDVEKLYTRILREESTIEIPDISDVPNIRR